MCILLSVGANTSVSSGTDDVLTVIEGESVDISCTSTGAPVPTISWTFGDLMTSFRQTDSPTPGSVVSTLHLVNTSYPAHDGVYVCTGSNVLMSSSASITVLVLGMYNYEKKCSCRCILISCISMHMQSLLLLNFHPITPELVQEWPLL